jgi:hypothetical protein
VGEGLPLQDEYEDGLVEANPVNLDQLVDCVASFDDAEVQPKGPLDWKACNWKTNHPNRLQHLHVGLDYYLSWYRKWASHEEVHQMEVCLEGSLTGSSSF